MGYAGLRVVRLAARRRLPGCIPARTRWSCCRWPARAPSSRPRDRRSWRAVATSSTALTDCVYFPVDTDFALTSGAGGRFALASARARRRLPYRYVAAAEVPVELRGAGACRAQVNNFGTPDVLEADRLIACEVITPAGNWSSYPPHKHEQNGPASLCSRRSTTSRWPTARRSGPGLPAGVRHAERPATCSPRCAPVTWCWSRTASTALDGRARVRPVLPERDGRARRRRVADLRRPGACLAARAVEGPWPWIRACRSGRTS